MKRTHHVEFDPTELPVTIAVTVQRKTGYGVVADLDGEEPADTHELQCLVAWADYGPILALPGRYGQSGRVVLDRDGEIDWERIGEAGAGRTHARRTRVDEDALERTLGLIDLLVGRVVGSAKYAVLKYLRMGILRPEHIVSADLRAAARLEARAKRLQQQLESRSRCGATGGSWRHVMPMGRERRRRKDGVLP